MLVSPSRKLFVKLCGVCVWKSLWIMKFWAISARIKRYQLNRGKSNRVQCRQRAPGALIARINDFSLYAELSGVVIIQKPESAGLLCRDVVRKLFPASKPSGQRAEFASIERCQKTPPTRVPSWTEKPLSRSELKSVLSLFLSAS